MYYSTFQCHCQQLSAFIFVVFLQQLSTHCLLTSLYCSAFQHLCQPLLDILLVIFLQHIDVCGFADMTLLYFYLVSLSRPVLISGQNKGFLNFSTFSYLFVSLGSGMNPIVTYFRNMYYNIVKVFSNDFDNLSYIFFVCWKDPIDPTCIS